MRLILAATFLLVLLLRQALAHQDPRGDVRPVVMAADGKFIVEFECNFADEWIEDPKPVFRMMWSPEGKLILPRHRVTLTSEESVAKEASWSWPRLPKVELIRFDDHQCRAALQMRIGRTITQTPLPLIVKTSHESADSHHTVITGPWVAFTWADVNNKSMDQSRVALNLSLVAKMGFVPGETVKLGHPAAIYDIPRSSPPLWAAGRWWVAWIREVPGVKVIDPDRRPWQTVLSSYSPTTKKHELHPLIGQSTWNTSPSMAVTNGWLCIAWNTEADYETEQPARIVTVFEKLPAP